MPLGAYKLAIYSAGDTNPPVWTTAAGLLGTFRPGKTIASQSADISVAAADEEGNGENFSITSGSLPTGLSMVDNGNGTATISGTPGQVTSSTTSNFDITVEDDKGNGDPRSFSIVIQPNYFGDSSDGAYTGGND
jgi:hypothetical protein|tara:strand:+ start:10388 stop:10792 length:405 start_codon:yes stop_codon:yes gene_type:complete